MPINHNSQLPILHEIKDYFKVLMVAIEETKCGFISKSILCYY